MKILTVQPAGSDAWKAAHAGRLGGHAIASILGVGRETPLQTWAKLTGKVPEDDLSKKPWIQRGIALEEAVARLYSSETGRGLMPTPGLVEHPGASWIACTPDRMVQFPSMSWGLVELKTAGFGRHHEWMAGAPLHVQVQLQFQLACCEMTEGSAACLPVDADDETPAVLWQDIPRDDVFLDRAMNALVDFRERYWLKDVPPPATDKDLGTVRKLFPTADPSKVVEMSQELDVRWRTRKDLLAEIREKQKIVDQIAAEAQQELGDALWCQGPGYVLRWQNEPRAAYTVEASSPRILREMKAVK